MKGQKRIDQLEFLKTVHKYSIGEKPLGLDTIAKITNKPIANVAYYRTKLKKAGIIESNGVNPNIPPFLYDRDEFKKLDMINDFIEYCKRENQDHSRYTNPLFLFCQNLQIHPKEFMVSKEHTEDLYLQFLKDWDPSLTDERYRKAIRKISKYLKITDMEESKVIYGKSDSKGDYATVNLSDIEFTQGIDFMDKELGPMWGTTFGLVQEIFPRPDVMFNWKPIIELSYVDVDGISYEIGNTSVYEPKQKKYYDKLILDPRVLERAKDLNPNKKIVDLSVAKAKTVFSETLRLFYRKLGKIEEGVKYEKGSAGWLYQNRPIYTLRHSAATMWMRRLAFNASLVATMGWEDPKTLTTYYARNTVNNILQAGVCYKCKPPVKKTDRAVFCSASHCAAYLNEMYGDSNG